LNITADDVLDLCTPSGSVCAYAKPQQNNGQTYNYKKIKNINYAIVKK